MERRCRCETELAIRTLADPSRVSGPRKHTPKYSCLDATRRIVEAWILSVGSASAWGARKCQLFRLRSRPESQSWELEKGGPAVAVLQMSAQFGRRVARRAMSARQDQRN